MRLALYLVTDPAYDGLVERVRAALGGGAPGEIGVCVRAKGASAAELAALARALRPICAEAGAPMLVNDRADVARVVGADGVHLPERGLSVSEAREVLGPAALVACSRHDRAGLERAASDGASFATLSPIHPVASKGAPIGVDGFARAVAGVDLPVYALGGVTDVDAPALVEAGAAGVAVVRAVWTALDPAEAARSLVRALRAGSQVVAGHGARELG